MKLNKLKVRNFKQFSDQDFEFNDDINILVGDNESGKSTVLEAIEICLNFLYRGKPLNMELSTDLFNNQCVANYLSSDKSQDKLPEILLEAFLDGNPELKGNNNSVKADTQGIFVRIYFDPDLSDSYEAFVAEPKKVTTLPVELYKIDWYSFAWKRLTHHNKKVSCLFVDPTRLHPSFGRTKYINSIINAALEKNARSALNLNYRQLKSRFDDEPEVIAINEKLDADNEVTDKSLKITADIASTTSWESNLQLAVNAVSFGQIGKGEQNQIQIKLALQNKAKDVDIVMLEEPENHLSHINLVKLISHIEKKNSEKQIFLTTHSSYVLNKLSINKLCLIADGYTKLKDIDKGTVKTLKRLPGYDTLRVVLAQKIILVEGPSDELLLKKIYINKHKCLPEEHGIDIIVVRGIGFKNYLNIAKPLNHPVRVVKDNDGNHQKNIIDWSKPYNDCEGIVCFSPEEKELYSLEPALIDANGATKKELDHLAKIMLSTQTFKFYEQENGTVARKAYLRGWFAGEKTGKKKVDSAIRIFDSDEVVNYPDYLVNAVTFDA
ncbi:AAA family ATPase [Desulfobulbus sp. US4]|nr:AAA family ATPase [Desulfobulbus sp. US4]